MSSEGEMTTTRYDRARGVLLGAAVGDALGAGYEFGSAHPGPDGPGMIGGGIGDFAPGEWTDDTAMTWSVAEVAARGLELASARALTAVAKNFRTWLDSGPPDVGIQTRQVVRAAGHGPTGEQLAGAARHYAAQHAHSAGNGSLMRTAPVALAHLGDPVACASAARAVSELTHADPLAGDACVLWSLAIRHAVVHEEFDVRTGLDALDESSRERWEDLIDQAEQRLPDTFTPNGFVVTAFQAAWSAINHTVDGRDGEAHVRAALAEVIAVGDDTDTTASIAGALLGARWGAAQFPTQWREVCHGYPGIDSRDLEKMATDIIDLQRDPTS
ncbi:ADP-ribosylglycohydrolase family protein [Dietzia sp. UBA5065]|uniref:ADP-ribosylglycohydrolase family protein n=1 Tax=Dietzia sp. UBA5065 TaxID=1946422 RepID=UPI0025BB1F6C|nr:ADP-ribosylglycohydrolase family protein [Dietzia sp. UBA5065]